MRASISAPFVDTAADELIWTLTHPPIDPLATRTVSVAGTEVGLHVLGASHQVILRSGALCQVKANRSLSVIHSSFTAGSSPERRRMTVPRR